MYCELPVDIALCTLNAKFIHASLGLRWLYANMAELKARGPKDKVEEMRVELYDKVNGLGIGAQGLGGLSTVLDVKIRTYPAHAANRRLRLCDCRQPKTQHPLAGHLPG